MVYFMYLPTQCVCIFLYCIHVNMYIQRGYSALMMAAKRGETGVVKELVEGGADLHLQNKVCQ